jgi:glycosyltransferase involved in cell wall biosynthesis
LKTNYVRPDAHLGGTAGFVAILAHKGVSIVIPVYNEAGHLTVQVRKLISFMRRQGMRFEVVLGDNGSADSTVAEGKRLARQYPRTVRLVSAGKRGVGNGFVAAAAAARFDYLVEMPLDFTPGLPFIPAAARLLDHHDIVVGSKVLGSQQRPAWLVVLSRGYITLANLLLGLGYGDYSVGAKAYRKSKIARFLGSLDGGSFYVTQLLYRGKAGGFKIIQIPVYCIDRRKSRFNFRKEVGYRTGMLIRLWLDRLRGLSD